MRKRKPAGPAAAMTDLSGENAVSGRSVTLAGRTYTWTDDDEHTWVQDEPDGPDPTAAPRRR